MGEKVGFQNHHQFSFENLFVWWVERCDGGATVVSAVSQLADAPISLFSF